MLSETWRKTGRTWVNQQMPKAMSAPNQGGAPSPEGGWSNEFATRTDATIVPPLDSSTVQACGVLASDEIEHVAYSQMLDMGS